MKKFIATMLVAAMSLSVSVTGFASAFADINNVPWEGAQGNIEKVYQLGLMTGDINNSGQRVFRAKDSMTYCESATIIYSFMKKVGLAESQNYIGKWSQVLEECNIPTWAQESVSYCLEKGFVNTAEVVLFMSGNTNNFATREKVATFLGRALDSTKMMGSATNSRLNFTDTGNVAIADVPFIQFLVEKNIISGDGTGKFNPAKSINRAEMATILARAYSAVEAQGAQTSTSVVTGEIVEISGTHITIHPKQGSEKKYVIANSNTLVVKYNGKSAALKDIASYLNDGEYLWCDLTLNSNGEVVLVQASEDSASKVLKGDVDSATSSQIVIVNNRKKYTYKLEDRDDLRIRLDGETVTLSSFKEYVKNEDVHVELSLDDDGYVKRITATTGAYENDEVAKGIIVRLSDEKITVRKNNENKIYHFADIDDVSFKIDGSKSNYNKLEELFNAGETISVTLSLNRSDKIVKLVANVDENQESNTITGTLAGVSSSKIDVQTERHTRHLPYSDSVKVTIDHESGMSVRDLRDLLNDGYDIEVTVKLVDEEATRITAVTTAPKEDKPVEIEYDGIVVSATPAGMNLQTRNRTISFTYNTNAIIKVDNNTVTADELADSVKAGYDITAEVIATDRGVILSVNATSSGSGANTNGIVEGMVERITPSAVTMRVAGESYMYTYTDDCQFYFGDETITIEDMTAFIEYSAAHAVVTLNKNTGATKIVFSEEK